VALTGASQFPLAYGVASAAAVTAAPLPAPVAMVVAGALALPGHGCRRPAAKDRDRT